MIKTVKLKKSFENYSSLDLETGIRFSKRYHFNTAKCPYCGFVANILFVENQPDTHDICEHFLYSKSGNAYFSNERKKEFKAFVMISNF